MDVISTCGVQDPEVANRHCYIAVLMKIRKILPAFLFAGIIITTATLRLNKFRRQINNVLGYFEKIDKSMLFLYYICCDVQKFGGFVLK